MHNKLLATAVRLATVGTVLASAAGTAHAQMLEEIIVTAQKRAESIQDVPIAISAFSPTDMDELQIDTGIDLQNYVPNMTYTGTGDYSIRGVGAAVGGTTGDVGVGIHLNNVPIIVNRTTTGELFDLERVEVLRGPQGTLYGRNATGGVVNFITAKPEFDSFSGSVFAEYGSYDTNKLSGHVNIPATDWLAIRLAGSYLSREGYTENVATGNDVDGRDLWSARLSVKFAPTENLESTLVWERTSEDDTRNNGTRRLCIKDEGPTMIGSTPVTSEAAQLYLSRGCSTGSVYGADAFQNVNSVATFGGRYAYLLGLVPGDTFAGQTQPLEPREASYYQDPEFVMDNDFVSWDTQWNMTDELQLNLLLGWAEDTLDTRTGSHEAEIGFADTPLTPGGIYNDFQGGPGAGIRTLTMDDRHTEQYSAELRLQSDFEGPINFNLGAFYFNVERLNTLFISTNSTSLFARASGLPLYFDTNADPKITDYGGHQYFASRTPYELDSRALFGEVYWDFNEEMKLTVGLRYTDDQKETDVVPVLLFVPEGENGPGTPGHPTTGPSSIQQQSVDFQEWTGRIVLDWRPNLSFTDDTLFYASVSSGYKSGGFNSPDDPTDGQTFTPYQPEYVNAFEVGTKNVFGDGRAIVNLSAFYYDYQDYQISFIEQFSARNTNVDATVFGVEMDASVELIDNLVLNGTVGWLDTEIHGGNSIDPFDRIQGQEGLTYLVSPQSGCVVPTAQLEPMINLINAGIVPASVLANASPGPGNDICEGGIPGIEPSAGVAANVEGNELPNSPPLSYALGASYTMQLGSDWNAMLRADYSWKDDSYTSHFNGESYELKAWQNANVSLIFDNIDMGVSVQLFAKNVLNDDDTVVGYDISGQGLGLVRTATLLDPRLYGVNVRYTF